ncbi:MAG TPA: hypothetical protein VMY36_03835 [Patescibacteria group bacterium]|nr:hypothetical protein [Patescibacteria group bacterium]
MKKWAILAAGAALLLAAVPVFGAKPDPACKTIQSGELYASTGELLTTGYDEYGYNYQAHMFNGRYCDYDRVIGGDYCDVDLVMKWNDAWLSNTDCNDDYLLDRYYGYTSYIGSGAWLTNHQTGVNEDGSHWEYFVKIVAAPADAENIGGTWYTADGVEIGPAIWGAFAIIQQVSNDPALDEHGLIYKSPASPGFGYYIP